MELVKTYDNVENISKETYIEDSKGNLTEIHNMEIGKNIDERPELRRIYYTLT